MRLTVKGEGRVNTTKNFNLQRYCAQEQPQTESNSRRDKGHSGVPRLNFSVNSTKSKTVWDIFLPSGSPLCVCHRTSSQTFQAENESTEEKSWSSICRKSPDRAWRLLQKKWRTSCSDSRLQLLQIRPLVNTVNLLQEINPPLQTLTNTYFTTLHLLVFRFLQMAVSQSTDSLTSVYFCRRFSQCANFKS